MARIDPFTKPGCVEPYCFPDLRHSTGDAVRSDSTRQNAFQRQFSVDLNDERRSGQRGEVCPPPWGSVNLSRDEGSVEEPHPDADAYREIIERLIQDNEKKLKAVYAKGKEEGRQEGLKQGREEGKTEGYENGKREGILQGRAEGEALVAPIADALREALDQFHALRKDALHEAREECVKLALCIAERILGTQLQLHPDTMRGIIEKACAMAAPSRILRMKLHPEAVNFCQNHPSLLTFLEDVVLIPDPGIAYGGCVLETDTGEIDARIESQLQLLSEAFERELDLSRHADPQETLS